MPKIEVVDEALIDAPVTAVYRAVMDEYVGATSWWMPQMELRHRKDTLVGKEGMVVDMTVHGAGTPRFSEKISGITEGRSINIEYEGDFEGVGEWIFEPMDGKTKVKYRFNGRPKRLLFILISPFVDLGKNHSKVMHKGFESLNNHLKRI
jgi:uncharacterized protein YndB with AHSA1/START domain